MHASTVACLLVMVPGCSPKKVRPDKEVCCIKKNVDDALQQNVFWKSSCETENVSADDIQSAGLTREQAVGLALRNSTTLQAKFRDLGIARADLEKAGLYKNPYLTTIIQSPNPNPFHVNKYVEVDITLSLSDLWLVPRRKKISDDQLEITTFDIMETIFEIRTNTIGAYNKYAFATLQADHAREVLERVKNLYENAEELKSDENFHDSQAAFVLINQMEIAVANAAFERKKALLEFADALGVSLHEQSFALHDQLGTVDLSASAYEMAQDNPKLIKACLKIQQEKHKKSLEKARYLEDVSVGVSYNSQPAKDVQIPGTTLGNIIAGPRLIGPIISMSIPIFDNKYADIARADFLIEKAESEYATVRDALTLKIALCKAEIEATTVVIEHYQKVLKSYEQSIEHESADPEATYAKKVKHLNTHISWFDKKNALFKSYLQLHNAIATLEQTVGKKIIS
jgi:cobalt-zinc-cadmium efflux system outer membrane protein